MSPAELAFNFAVAFRYGTAEQIAAALAALQAAKEKAA